MGARTAARGLLSIIFVFLFGLSGHARSEVKVSGRHVYVYYPGVDAVWGSYLFLVTNTGKEPTKYSFPVFLPKETVDFQGQEGFGPDELKLGADGGLLIDRVFQPGEELLNVGFKVPAKNGLANLTYVSPYAFDSLSLFVWQDSMDVKGENIEVRKGVPFSGRFYDTYTVQNGQGSQTLSFQLTGVPEGRGQLWVIGWCFAGIALLAGLALAYTSRPQISSQEDVI